MARKIPGKLRMSAAALSTGFVHDSSKIAGKPRRAAIAKDQIARFRENIFITPNARESAAAAETRRRGFCRTARRRPSAEFRLFGMPLQDVRSSYVQNATMLVYVKGPLRSRENDTRAHLTYPARGGVSLTWRRQTDVPDGAPAPDASVRVVDMAHSA